MGSVWEGTHVTLGTHVAVKFIDSEYAESPEAVYREGYEHIRKGWKRAAPA